MFSNTVRNYHEGEISHYRIELFNVLFIYLFIIYLRAYCRYRKMYKIL